MLFISVDVSINQKMKRKNSNQVFLMFKLQVGFNCKKKMKNYSLNFKSDILIFIFFLLIFFTDISLW